MNAAGSWIDPEKARPYPGQRVLACWRRETKGGSVSMTYELLTYEHNTWYSPDMAYREAPWRWAMLIAPPERIAEKLERLS
jgi:hypothetical protein